MKTFFYWFSVVLSIISVITINLIFDFRITVVTEFFICLLVVVLPSILFFFLDRFIPKQWYGENNKLFNERKFEKKFLNAIKIKKWKDNVPQFLKIDNISKTKDKIDKEYIEFFISETRRGELMHLFDVLFGIIASIFLPKKFLFRYTLPILFFWTFFNLLSILIQRYNRPRLKKALQRFENQSQSQKIETSLDEEELQHKTV